MLLYKLCTGEAFLLCVYGYVVLSYLLDDKNIHIEDIEMLSQYYGYVYVLIDQLVVKMFLSKPHMENVFCQSEENCAFLDLIILEMFPYKHCIGEAFPWCVLNCVQLSDLM